MRTLILALTLLAASCAPAFVGGCGGQFAAQRDAILCGAIDLAASAATGVAQQGARMAVDAVAGQLRGDLGNDAADRVRALLERVLGERVPEWTRRGIARAADAIGVDLDGQACPVMDEPAP